MAPLLNLSLELHLCIFAYLSRADLLNVSVTCKYLRAVTEPELYREFSIGRRSTQSFIRFLTVLLQYPERQKYVKSLELYSWSSLQSLNPGVPGFPVPVHWLPNFPRDPEAREADYEMFTNVAKTAGLIDTILPYEPTSSLVERALSLRALPTSNLPEWHKRIYDPDADIDDVSYDQKFCQLLRAGLEDPLVAILLAILPDVQKIVLHLAPEDNMKLPWKNPPHRFQALRKLFTRSDSEYNNLIAFFNVLLQGGGMEAFESHGGGSYWCPEEFSFKLYDTSIQSFHLQPKTLSLHRLVLEQCDLPLFELQVLVTACHRLRTFYYSCTNCDREYPCLFPADLVEALAPHKDSLETLHLAVPYVDKQTRLLGDLSGFSKLESLNTTPDMWHMALEGSDIAEDHLSFRLPRSLVDLTFNTVSKADENESRLSSLQIEDLYSTRHIRLPNLRQLTLVAQTRGVKRHYLRAVAAAKQAEMSVAKPLIVQLLRWKYGRSHFTQGPLYMFNDLPDVNMVYWGKGQYLSKERENDLEMIGQGKASIWHIKHYGIELIPDFMPYEEIKRMSDLAMNGADFEDDDSDMEGEDSDTENDPANADQYIPWNFVEVDHGSL
jgi:hypothetical protein